MITQGMVIKIVGANRPINKTGFDVLVLLQTSKYGSTFSFKDHFNFRCLFTHFRGTICKNLCNNGSIANPTINGNSPYSRIDVFSCIKLKGKYNNIKDKKPNNNERIILR